MHRRQFLSLTALSGLTLLSNFSFANDTPLVLPEKLQHNPLLEFNALPNFADVKPAHIKPAIEFLIGYNKEVTEFVSSQANPTWQNFYLPLQSAQNKLERAWHIVNHLYSVKNSESLRKAYDVADQAFNEFMTWQGMHKKLYEGYVKLKNAPAFSTYSQAQKQAINNALRDFELSGITLTGDKAKRYSEIVAKLSELSTKFENNTLDATMGYEILINANDKKRLKGFSDDVLARAKQNSKEKGKQGYRFGLDYPSYFAVMSYADDRDLRKEMYSAYITRASDKGPNAKKWDNTATIKEIVALRYEMANLLGYETYAHYALATRMAESPAQVMGFLNELLVSSTEKAKEEVRQLEEFGKSLGVIDTLHPWDIAYLAEKERLAKYDVDQEYLRNYFPEDVVLAGMFDIIGTLYGFQVKELDTKANNIKVWHDDVRFFEIHKDGQVIAHFYADLYAREHKQGGAWMDSAVARVKFADGSLQLPVAQLVCNFTRPSKNKPPLLLHSEVTTLFHEFGHTLHGMLTQMDIYSISGINGVAWDAVEFPSQMLENWTWEKSTLKRISKHYQTGEPLSDEVIDKLISARNHLAARMVVRQLELGLFDFRINLEYRPDGQDYLSIIRDDIKQKVSIIPEPEWTRIAHTFTHVFAGGYAAGYYSYLWADVLASDAYTRFEKDGIFNPATGQAFVNAFLGQGGSDKAMTLFVNFMGHEPDPKALLRKRGIL